jgi:hypothetical protein
LAQTFGKFMAFFWPKLLVNLWPSFGPFLEEFLVPFLGFICATFCDLFGPFLAVLALRDPAKLRVSVDFGPFLGFIRALYFTTLWPSFGRL